MGESVCVNIERLVFLGLVHSCKNHDLQKGAASHGMLLLLKTLTCCDSLWVYTVGNHE